MINQVSLRKRSRVTPAEKCVQCSMYILHTFISEIISWNSFDCFYQPGGTVDSGSLKCDGWD